METVRLIIDGAAMAELLRGPEGPVAHHMIRIGDAVIAEARHNLEPHKRTGNLARSIVKRPTTGPHGIGMLVIAGVGLKPPYAVWVHEGNGPPGSRIYPKHSKALAWVTSGARPTDKAGWQAARAEGRAVVRPSVAASKPIPYLRDALTKVIAATAL